MNITNPIATQLADRYICTLEKQRASYSPIPDSSQQYTSADSKIALRHFKEYLSSASWVYVDSIHKGEL